MSSISTTTPQQQEQKQQQPIYQVRKLLRGGDEDFVGNSHWASNCEDCQEDVKIERDPVTKFPLSYQCDKNPQWVTSSTMVQFDYELAIVATESQQDNVLAMQWQFLEQVAERAGLSERCNFEYQFEEYNYGSGGIRPRNKNNGNSSGRKRRRRLLNKSKSLYYPTTIYAIRSLPKDRAGKIGDCLSLSYDSKTSECFPVTAIMTVKYRGEPQDAIFVQEYVKSVIQEQLQNDPSKLYVQDVTGLEYVGERTHVVKSDDNSGPRIEAKQGFGIATMATVVSLSTLVCLIVAILMMRKKKSIKETDSSPTNVKIVNLPFDLQECSTDSLDDLPPVGGQGSGDDDEYDVPLTLMASTEEMELPPFMDNHHHHYHADQDYSYDPHDDPTSGIHDLPPPPIQLQMPPIGRPLKVQRKRKQKGGSSISRSSSFSTLLPISETNSENESESLVSIGDVDDSEDQGSDIINLSFGDEESNLNEESLAASDSLALVKNYELIMDEIFLTKEKEEDL